MTTKCMECGTLIDVAADTPNSHVPCPNCGSTKRTVQLTAGGPMRPSNYMLDNFVAHKLSLVTECGARELPTNTNWLSTFILNNVFFARLAAERRAYIFNFLRRAEGASSAYREARSALMEYLETPRHVLSPYFRALLYFEVCISQCYQGYELLATATRKDLYIHLGSAVGSCDVAGDCAPDVGLGEEAVRPLRPMSTATRGDERRP